MAGRKSSPGGPFVMNASAKATPVTAGHRMRSRRERASKPRQNAYSARASNVVSIVSGVAKFAATEVVVHVA
jgi:hypothetical protein